jgi:DNA modification methylase
MEVPYMLEIGKMEEVLKDFPADSFDSIVTDPPYGFKFMGKKWDYQVPSVKQWEEAYRVLKPGGYLVCFGGSRTFHRVTVNIEDAGFEIRDTIMWVYGSGFPKNMDVSKAIDKAKGADREIIGEKKLWGHNAGSGAGSFSKNQYEGMTGQTRTEPITAPSTELAKQWDGWGTALKPAYEPIIIARKPLEGTVAENIEKWGVGGINIDDCRVPTEGQALGRFPANLLHDGSDEVMELFPSTKSGKPGIMRQGVNNSAAYGAESRKPGTPMTGFGDEGSAARFFYCAKATKADRDKGCDGNSHPTVKPTSLMQYLCKLVTPKGGMILDPFMGSGSTGKAAVMDGYVFVGIDMDGQWIPVAEGRIKSAYEINSKAA